MNDELIKLALKEAIDARKDILHYDIKHPNVHDPNDITRYIVELNEMEKLLKGML